MSLNPVGMMDKTKLEKILLTKRVGQFLSAHAADDERREAVENVARALANDIAEQVREALAFELRMCPDLPHDLAARIASDVESVAGPFLATTTCFTDGALARLLPHLEEHAHITLARRSDLGAESIYALVTVASERAVTYLVRNDQLRMPTPAFTKVVGRFASCRSLMDRLSLRADLPIAMIDQLIELVSDECRRILVVKYDIEARIADTLVSNSHYDTLWKKLRLASPHQIHAFVIDQKKRGRLSRSMILNMLGRGCVPFLESAVALELGLTLGAVRQVFDRCDTRTYFDWMQQAGYDRKTAEKCRDIILNHRQFGE